VTRGDLQTIRAVDVGLKSTAAVCAPRGKIRG
jgi:hypothetical protein